MPTYDFKCDACQHSFEEFQSMSAKPLKKCPKCGKMSVKRLIGTGAALIFKGSGFYETDYRSDSYQKAAKAEKQQASSTTEKSDTKTESKTASSTEKAGTKDVKTA